MSRPIVLSEGEIYHVYNRGTEKRDVFIREADYERFLALLYLSNATNPVHISNYQGSTLMTLLSLERGKTLVDLLGYCLMPNHFHLIIHEHSSGGISKFMQKLGNGYTGYFNIRNARTGGLFQGKFKASHVDSDPYLSYLLAYAHLNPVKLIEPQWKELGISDVDKAERFLQSYRYSSYLDYCGAKRPEGILIQKDMFPTEFSAPKDFAENVRDWLYYKKPSI